MQDGYDAVLANIEAAAEAGEDIHEEAKTLAMEAFEQRTQTFKTDASSSVMRCSPPRICYSVLHR